MKNRKSYVNLVIEIKGNLVDGKDFFNQLEKLNKQYLKENLSSEELSIVTEDSNKIKFKFKGK